MSMLTDAQLKQRRAAGKARAKQFTREFQQMARSHVKRESLVKGGKKGYQVTFAAGKLGIIQAKMTVRNMKNASAHHKQVRAQLLEWGVGFAECQFPFSDAMHEVDFLLSPKRVIEVDGYRFKEAPFGNTERDYQSEFDKKRRRLESNGYEIFVFDSRFPKQEFGRLGTWLQGDKAQASHVELPF